MDKIETTCMYVDKLEFGVLCMYMYINVFTVKGSQTKTFCDSYTCMCMFILQQY